MAGIHGSYAAIYIVGIILMLVNILQSIFRKKGYLFNPPAMEEAMDEKTFLRIRVLYGVSQSVMLLLFLLCFIYVKNYVAALFGLFAGCLLPIALVFLYDMYLSRQNEGAV